MIKRAKRTWKVINPGSKFVETTIAPTQPSIITNNKAKKLNNTTSFLKGFLKIEEINVINNARPTNAPNNLFRYSIHVL